MAKSCGQYREDLSSNLDAELHADRQSEIAAHLAVCADCKSEFQDFQRLARLLNESKEHMPVPDLWEGLSASLPSVCEVIAEDLSAYLDGELPAAAAEGVNIHLRDCADCRQRFKLLNATNQLLSKGLELSASHSVDLWPAVKSRLNEDCALIQGELSAFVDLEVSAARHRSITTHLMDCPGCKKRFEELTQVGEVLREHYQPHIPDDFDLWPQIKSKMQVVPFVPRSANKTRFGGGHRLYLVGAAAVVVGVLGSLVFLILGPSGDSRVTPVSAEAYLLDSALNEPTDSAETIVYGNQ